MPMQQYVPKTRSTGPKVKNKMLSHKTKKRLMPDVAHRQHCMQTQGGASKVNHVQKETCCNPHEDSTNMVTIQEK